MRIRWTAVAAVCAVAARASPVAAQAADGTVARWAVRSSPAVDLWYYGLGRIDFGGPGRLAYYSASFAERARAARRARGEPASLLDSEGMALRASFLRDSAFESLHFLPLYTSSGDPARLIAFVRAVGAGTGGEVPASAGGRDVTPARDALARVIGGTTQLAALARFADALEGELPFFRAWRGRTAAADARRLAALERRWNGDFVPLLDPYLRAMGLERGVVLVSPPVALEGRLLRSATTLVVVGWPADGPDDAPLLFAVRELCFPLVERVQGAAVTAPRLQSIDVNGSAAVRCGAMLLDASGAPHALVADYRRLFLDRPAASDRVGPAFAERFALPPTLEQSLRVEIARMTSGARAAPSSRR